MRELAGKRSMSGFETPARLPTGRENRCMLAIDMKKAMIANLSGHVYTFDGKTFIQGKGGGSIGSEFTGELARLYMLLWDKRFLERLKNIGIRVSLYKRYVDDFIIVMEKVMKEFMFKGKSMVKREENDTEEEENKHTLNIVSEIANTMDKDIVMEPDVGEDQRCASNRNQKRKQANKEEIVLEMSCLFFTKLVVCFVSFSMFYR